MWRGLVASKPRSGALVLINDTCWLLGLKDGLMDGRYLLPLLSGLDYVDSGNDTFLEN